MWVLVFQECSTDFHSDCRAVVSLKWCLYFLYWVSINLLISALLRWFSIAQQFQILLLWLSEATVMFPALIFSVLCASQSRYLVWAIRASARRQWSEEGWAWKRNTACSRNKREIVYWWMEEICQKWTSSDVFYLRYDVFCLWSRLALSSVRVAGLQPSSCEL